jgi:tetratricopeptide (TPR) repeat protein
MKLLSFLLYISIIGFTNAQTSTVKETAAVEYFNKGLYSKALTEFKILATKFPKDPYYQYYQGVCMVQTNTGLSSAVECLKTAALKNVPPDVYYYLGKAYYNLFLFSEAQNAFEQFKENAGWRTSVKHELNLISIANSYFDSASVYKVLWKKQVILRELPLIFDTLKIYKTVKPLKLSQEYYHILGNNSIIIESVNRAEPGATNYDLQITNKASRFINFKNINTSSDEGWAYYDEFTNQLFFSSKGHNSVGEYDIFVAQWLDNDKKWSEPRNVGFPINTPYSEIMLAFNGKSNELIFASNRECVDSLWMVYKIIYDLHNPKKLMKNSMDILTASILSAPKQNSKIRDPQSKPKISETKSFSQPLLYPTDYLSNISNGLHSQYSTDSLLWVIRNQKNFMQSLTDKTERANQYSKISAIEKDVKQHQQQASEFFNKAHETENLNTYTQKTTVENNEKPSKSNPKSEVNDFSILNKCVYSDSNPVPINIILPQGLLYTIQLGAFSRNVDVNHLGNLQPIFGEIVNESNLVKFYAGKFSKLKFAEEAQQKIKELGHKNAFIIAFYDGKRIANDRAVQLEKLK